MQLGQQRKISQDGWVEERCIGAGSFGTVTLWENKITKEQIVLKKCRLDLNSQNKKQWQTEVQIMKSLNHPNIVMAKEVPEILDVKEGQLPLLGMEYCQGGDLRKILSTPENCVGLKELTVIKVTADMANAVQFLHTRRIIHRDLKPENVVITYLPNGLPVYKLIDLGYAKQLDQGSMASTFVGTLKYLAPELLAGNGSYTKTVDYWSLGTVVFECITGHRPFPDLSPVQWHMEIRQKSPRDIYAYFDTSGYIKFSDVFPAPNSLSSCFQEKFVVLLRLLLLWDSTARGGIVDSSNHTRECFQVLDDIINTKALHVFCVSTSILLSFEVLPNLSISDLKVKIQEQTGIPLYYQELLTPNGDEPENAILVNECLDKMVNEQQVMFLFSRNETPQSPGRAIFSLSSTVQAIVTEASTLLPFEELKKVQGEALHFCHQQMESYQRLLQALRVAMKHVLKLNSRLCQLKNAVSCDLLRLQERVLCMKDSLYTDLEHYADMALSLNEGDGLLRSWKEAERKAEQLLSVDVGTREKQVASLQSHVMELQRNPNTHTQNAGLMDDIYDEASNVYKAMKQMMANTTVYDPRVGDCSKMAPVVMRCLTTRERLIRDVSSHLSRVLQLTSRIQALLPDLHNTREEINRRRLFISEMQRRRQDDIWKLLERRTTTLSNSIASSANPSADFKSSDDTSTLMGRSVHDMERFAKVLSSVKTEQDIPFKCLDWSFLNVEGNDD